MRASENLPMLRKAIVTMFAMAVSLLAADINGNWTGKAEGPNGTLERTFTFKVDGTKLTGETNSEYTGKSQIQDGKVEGEAVSFTIKASIQGNDVTLQYAGTASASGFKMTSKMVGASDFPPIQWTLTKAK